MVIRGADQQSSEDLVRFDRAALLAVLEQLRACASIAALRVVVAGLRQGTDAHDSPLRARQEDPAPVIVPRAYWLGELEQISGAYTIDRGRYYVERLIRSITEVRSSSINEINLNRWKTYDDIYTDSWWPIERRDSTGAHSADYWGNFVPQIPHQMMRRYTRSGEWVLDPFAGSGTTLIEARRLGRHCLGVELQPGVAEQARQAIDSEPDAHGVVCAVEAGDSTRFDFAAALARHGARSAQLAILHPPYHDIIRFSDHPHDLSNARSVEAFLEMFGRVVENVAACLDRERYMALVIGDKYARGEWVPLGFRAMEAVLARGFMLKSIVVKNFDSTAGKRAQRELWKYRALAGGFYVFKHEYIFVFRKR